MKGALVEYGLSVPPLAVVFDFNPQTISRTRTITLKAGTAPGTGGGYDFTLPTETARASQGVSVQPETFTIEMLIDAQDRMHADAVARTVGIEPQLDTLRSMVEPKIQGPGGLQLLSSLGQGGERAFQRQEHASVLLFIWGTHGLPGFLTTVKVDEKAHLASLVPYQANVSLTMQVIEGNNPFYTSEKLRQAISAALNVTELAGVALGGSI